MTCRSPSRKSSTARLSRGSPDLTILPVAAFIVQCAQFIYTMHKDSLRKEKLDAEALKRTLRLELGLPEHVTIKVRDDVIDAMIEEVKYEE